MWLLVHQHTVGPAPEEGTNVKKPRHCVAGLSLAEREGLPEDGLSKWEEALSKALRPLCDRGALLSGEGGIRTPVTRR